MDYAKIHVIRDKERCQTYVALPNGKKILITDSGQEKMVEDIPEVQPDTTPTRDKKIFRIQPWPLSALEVPPLSVVVRIQELIAEAEKQTGQKSA